MEGIERFFIEKYNELEKERDELRERVVQLEADITSEEMGITDLHRKYKAVKGSVISKNTIKSALVDDKEKLPKVKKYLELTDDEIIAKFINKSVRYYTILEYEEKTFQYTLAVKESREEFLAFTDGCGGDTIRRIYDDEEISFNTWLPFEKADELKKMLVDSFRENLEEAIEEREREWASDCE